MTMGLPRNEMNLASRHVAGDIEAGRFFQAGVWRGRRGAAWPRLVEQASVRLPCRGSEPPR